MSKTLSTTVWAFNAPAEDYAERIFESVKLGKSRFGWGYADLLLLIDKPWEEMTSDEQISMSVAFLLRIQPGDWIVHVNVPTFGLCIAVPVTGSYEFDTSNEWEDYHHVIPVDGSKSVEFDRNDLRVHPLVSRGLKPRRRYQRVKATDEFFSSLERLTQTEPINESDVSKELSYFLEELESPLTRITELIHTTHNGKKLEYLVAEIFEAMPQVTKAQVNGSGWGTDYGADVIITYASGLPIYGLEQPESILVVQVKSYEGQHWETEAVDQIKTAMIKFNANAGLLITTAEKTATLEEALNDLCNDEEITGRPVSIIAGSDVARFMLKHGGELLLGAT